MEALDLIFGLISEESDQERMASSNVNPGSHTSQNESAQGRPVEAGLDLGRSGIFVFSPPKDISRESASADFEAEIALQSLTSHELEERIAQQALESNLSTATDASIASCSSEASNVSEYTKVLSELAADAEVEGVKRIDLNIGLPFIQHMEKVNGDRAKRGLSTIDMSDAPSKVAPPGKSHRTCTSAEGNKALRSPQFKNGGGEALSKKLKKVGVARGKAWIDWFLLKLAAIGVVSIGAGCAAGAVLVAFSCSTTFVLITGLVVACGVGYAGYKFFLAEPDEE